MPRIAKEGAPRRNEILDVAQRLIYTKGYEQMTIQDILDDLGISKGAFYHYFGSKQALLEALIDRILQSAEEILTPVLSDPHLPALEKLHHFFDTAMRWKTAQKTFFLAVLRVWYADENTLVRQKVTAAGLERLLPHLQAIIRQGIAEGVFKNSHPQQAGEVVLLLLEGMGNAVARLLLMPVLPPDILQQMQDTCAVYTDALERVLGAPPGTIQVVEPGVLKEWVE